ncbi:MAG TPA: hypothetical protein O0X23_05410 [Methanocorpusculum sp.]|nr:hypothetical protein [Methanocorpusculum sp.]
MVSRFYRTAPKTRRTSSSPSRLQPDWIICTQLSGTQSELSYAWIMQRLILAYRIPHPAGAA